MKLAHIKKQKNTAGKPAAFSLSKINQIHSKY